jgi:hypothetical protein
MDEHPLYYARAWPDHKCTKYIIELGPQAEEADIVRARTVAHEMRHVFQWETGLFESIVDAKDPTMYIAARWHTWSAFLWFTNPDVTPELAFYTYTYTLRPWEVDARQWAETYTLGLGDAVHKVEKKELGAFRQDVIDVYYPKEG